MYPVTTPNSSPLGSRGSRSSIFQQLYSPECPSPLNASSRKRSPIRNAQARREYRKEQYKSQISMRTPFSQVTGGRLDSSSPAGQLLHHRFKAHCLERVRQKRKSLDHLLSSDGFDMEGDYDMDEDVEEDENTLFQDELYRRVMLNEIRKSKYAIKLSFELEFGSSIDPNMYDDMGALERGFTGKDSKLTEEELDIENEDAMIAEYLAELEEPELHAMQERVSYGMVDLETEDPSELERQFAPQQPSPSRSMYSELARSSPPSSPVFHTMSMEEDNDVLNCPFCHSPRLHDHVACANCVRTRSLEYAETAWSDPQAHSTSLDRFHKPLVAETPTGSGVGAMMLCSAEGCDWCFAL